MRTFFTKSHFVGSLIIIGAMSLSSSARASCGLAGCPVNVGESFPQANLIDQAFRYVTFDINGHDGDYLQYEPRYEYRGLRKMIVGGYASVVGLDDGHNSESGLGNPVVFGQYEAWSRDEQSVSLGSQLELAMGDDDKGIAAEHTEWVPYVTYSNSSQPMHWMASVGYRFSLDNNDDDGHKAQNHTELFVNPHADRELLYRWHAFFSGNPSHISPEIFLDGQHALDGEDDGTGFLSFGAGLQCALGPQLSLTPKMEFPLTSPKRFDSKFSLHAALTF